MNTFNRYILPAALLLAGFATGSYAADIEVSGAWARATAPGQQAASVDATLTSKQDATVVGVSSPVAGTAALHSMTMDGGMMKMRQVDSIALPAGKAVNLHDGGYHLMLEGLKAPLKEGDTVPLTLSIMVGNRMEKVEVRAAVGSLTATEAPTMKHDHEHMHMNMKMD